MRYVNENSTWNLSCRQRGLYTQSEKYWQLVIQIIWNVKVLHFSPDASSLVIAYVRCALLLKNTLLKVTKQAPSIYSKLTNVSGRTERRKKKRGKKRKNKKKNEGKPSKREKSTRAWLFILFFPHFPLFYLINAVNLLLLLAKASSIITSVYDNCSI